ncbi:MAG TPA: ABC transporter permease [Terriglobales bacterium]
MLNELRMAVRRLRRHFGFTLLAVATLAIGIGASTTIFSVVNPVLWKSLPYPDADRILSISENTQTRPLDVTFGTFLEISQRASSIAYATVFRTWQPSLIGDEEPERIDGQRISADYFKVLGVQPAIGRIFDADADRPNGPQQVVISNALWQRRFANARDVVGRELKLDGVQYTVMGVMPANFENVALPTAQVWTALQYDRTFAAGFNGREWGHHLSMLVRLRPGTSVQAARAELDAIARQPLPQFARPPWASLDGGIAAVRLQEKIAQDIRPALLAISAAVLLLLLIACANIVNLLLASAVQRDGEFAVRSALGAGRLQIARQLFAETFVLALVACALGDLLANVAVHVLLQMSPPELPRRDAIRVDSAVFLFSVLLSVCAAALAGAAPALHAFKENLAAMMQSRSRSIASGRHWLRRALVFVEFALAMVLLVYASMLIHSVHRLFAIPLGFDATHVLTMQVQDAVPRERDDAVSPQGRTTVDARGRFYEQALAAVRRLPGAKDAAFTSQLPLGGMQEDGYGVMFDSDPPDSARGAYRYSVTPGYIEAMRIPLLRGRLLNDHDTAGSQHVAVISSALAKQRFGAADPIGHTLKRPGSNESFVVVGVVGDVKQQSLTSTDAEAFYVPQEQWDWVDGMQTLVLRSGGDPAALTNSVRSAIWSVNKDQPVVRVATMQSLVQASQVRRQFALMLFNTFAGIALVLAAIGMYGVLSGSVQERMREIGVRAAFGASRQNLLALVLKQSVPLILFGAALGLAISGAAIRVISALLFNVSRLDLASDVTASAVLIVVAAIACIVPAWRAATVDPAVVLRSE